MDSSCHLSRSELVDPACRNISLDKTSRHKSLISIPRPFAFRSAMSSPTALVPASIISKHRKTTRHAFDELIARGPGSTSPEVVKKALPEDHAGGDGENVQISRTLKGKQPVYTSEETEFVAPLDMPIAVRRMSVVSVTIKEESDDEGQDLCVICLQAVRDPTIVGECGHQIFCVSPGIDCLEPRQLICGEWLSLNVSTSGPTSRASVRCVRDQWHRSFCMSWTPPLVHQKYVLPSYSSTRI